MRYLDGLRNHHQGKQIWIIGCGPSIEAFPTDFFNDKISIALNWAYIAFPNTTYAHWYHSIWGGHKEYAAKHLDILKKAILPLPHELVNKPEDYGENHELPIWMNWKEAISNSDEFAEGVKWLIEGKTDLCRSRYTVAHTAIQAAAFLGSKDIVLVGCEHHVGKGRNNAGIRGMNKFNVEIIEKRKGEDGKEERVIKHKPYGNNLDGTELEWLHHTFKQIDDHWKQARIGTYWLAELLGKYGVKLRRYFYSEGYKKIEKEEKDESY